MVTYQAYRKQMRRRWLLACGFLMFLSFLLGAVWATAQSWPDFDSKWKFEITKKSGAEMTDPFWMHLHAGHAGHTSVTMAIEITQANPVPLPPSAIPPGNQVRYVTRGVPLSGWLGPPWEFTLDITNPALDQILDGIHAITLEVQGPDRQRIRPLAVYLHLARGRQVDPTVPIIAHNATTNYDDYEHHNSQGPGVVYVSRTDRHMQGYPADPSVVAWHTPPYEADLYQELMAPNSDLFLPIQFWWEEPETTVSAGMKFIRGFGSKFGGDHVPNAGLYNWRHLGGPQDANAFGWAGHRNLPFKDGPRGIAWVSPFVTGQVDSHGGLAFVESGGPLRYMHPTGEVVTVAGWRVDPAKDPVWIEKPLTLIRRNMQFRGTWLNGQRSDPANWGFWYPTDVAIDPQNENIWYVTGPGDHCVWKVTIADRTSWHATVEVFAGSADHRPGSADGQGTAARFNAPSSLVFDPVCDCLYVADQMNNAIRRISRTGTVTTLVGSPGMGQRLSTRGLPSGHTECWPDPPPMQCYNEQATRRVGKLEVTAAEAAAGVKPDVYLPMTVRVDSKGNIVVLDMGFATISRINPLTLETKKLADIEGRHERFLLGWAWLDVDRWGNSGPLDSIYWVQGTSGGIVDGEDPNDRHVNELLAWLPADGGKSKWVTGKDWQPYPDGWGPRATTDVGHYPWLIAIDPRGAFYVSGMAEHGIQRFRMRRPNDPVPTNWMQFVDGKLLWLKGPQPGGHSYSFVFGHGGHNYLGFPDTWGLQPGVTDDEIKTRFQFQPGMTATQTTTLLNYVRLNAGRNLSIVQPAPDTQPPTAPGGLTATLRTETAITLAWQPGTDNIGIVGYKLTRNGTGVQIGLTMTHTDTGLTPGTTYAYTVQAQDAAGNLSPPAQLSAETLAPTPPPPPQPAFTPALVGTWPVGTVTLDCTAIGAAAEAEAALRKVEACVGQ